MRQQPFASPEEALEHHGVKGMKWGVRKKEETNGRHPAGVIQPGTPEYHRMVQRVTRTDKPQVITTGSGKIGGAETQKHGLTDNQKMLLAFGALTAAAAGYVAYQHYAGNTLGPIPEIDAKTLAAHERTLVDAKLGEMKLPKAWNVAGLNEHPISTSPLGNLARDAPELKLLHPENLVINTSRGYADILPKNGFDNPFAAKQHASVTKVLEEMRDKFPAIRNMNIEVVPMSHVADMENANAHMAVLSMRAGEARVMYNDLMDEPTEAVIRRNRKFLPGLGHRDYVAYHEMGHLLAVAHGDIPPAAQLLTGGSPTAWRTWQTAEPLLHRQTFAKHGFSFKELSKLSQYAATEPAEAMAELVGHYFTPTMRGHLTPDQFARAEAMINEMGGLT